jgi:hypothetical protein
MAESRLQTGADNAIVERLSSADNDASLAGLRGPQNRGFAFRGLVMHSLLIVTVCVSMAAAAPAPADKDEPPAKKELFAKEGWYKDQKGDEVTVAGVLQKRKGDGGIGTVQRFNPYYLTSTETQTVTVSVPIGGGKFVPETRRVELKKECDIYVGGKNDILDGYIGKKVQFTGKAVNLELEGRSFHELWPARVELEPKMNDRKPELKQEEKK